MNQDLQHIWLCQEEKKVSHLHIYVLPVMLHLLKDRRDPINAYSYVWATLFSRDAGLALQAIYGDYGMGAFDEASQRMIILAGLRS